MSYVRKPQATVSRAASLAPEVVTAPPERWQHGQARGQHDDLRTAERVVDGVQTLFKAGDISDAAVVAAGRFYRDYVEGVEGARDPERRSSGAAPDPHMTQLVRVRAIQAHRAVRAVLGEGTVIRLQAFLVEELSFSGMATRFTPGKDRASGVKWFQGWLAANLECLAETYARLDRERHRNVDKDRA